MSLIPTFGPGPEKPKPENSNHLPFFNNRARACRVAGCDHPANQSRWRDLFDPSFRYLPFNDDLVRSQRTLGKFQ